MGIALEIIKYVAETLSSSGSKVQKDVYGNPASQISEVVEHSKVMKGILSLVSVIVIGAGYLAATKSRDENEIASSALGILAVSEGTTINQNHSAKDVLIQHLDISDHKMFASRFIDFNKEINGRFEIFDKELARLYFQAAIRYFDALDPQDVILNPELVTPVNYCGLLAFQMSDLSEQLDPSLPATLLIQKIGTQELERQKSLLALTLRQTSGSDQQFIKSLKK